MNRVLLASLFFALILVIRPGIAYAFNEPLDFRGVPFGADIKDLSHKKMKFLDESNGIYSYVSEIDKNEIGGAQVKRITYNFFKDRLFGVQILVEGRDSVPAILKAFLDSYGRDYQEINNDDKGESSFNREYRWGYQSAANTKISLHIQFGRNTISTATATYIYMPVFKDYVPWKERNDSNLQEQNRQMIGL